MAVESGTLGLTGKIQQRRQMITDVFRDLKLAGRAMVRQADGKVKHQLVHINKPILRVPNLCIHLNRGVNDSFGPNKETEMVPILAQQATYELNKPAEEKDNSYGSGTSIKGTFLHLYSFKM